MVCLAARPQIMWYVSQEMGFEKMTGNEMFILPCVFSRGKMLVTISVEPAKHPSIHSRFSKTLNASFNGLSENFGISPRIVALVIGMSLIIWLKSSTSRFSIELMSLRSVFNGRPSGIPVVAILSLELYERILPLHG